MAFAACSTPTGTAGDQIYSSTYNQMMFCNGTSWINMGSSGTVSGIGTLTAGDFCTSDGSVINCTTGTVSLTTQVSGTLQAAQMLALTGDVTNSAGAVATTVGKINGVALGSTTATAGNLLIGSGTQWVTNAVSGDITITSGGVTAIGSAKVTNSMLAGSIALSKLSTTGTPSSSNYLRGDGAWSTVSTSQWTTTGSDIYYTTGNVGIGTTAPQSALHVNAGEVQVGSSGASCTAANAGAIRFSSSTFYGCTGSAWIQIVSGLPTITTTGSPTITTSGGYTIYTFNAGGSLIVSGGSVTAASLVVAAGGGGGGQNTQGPYGSAGGGGAGGYIYTSAATLTAGSYPATVGTGGAGGASGAAGVYANGSQGGNSAFNGNTAIGGGGGGEVIPLELLAALEAEPEAMTELVLRAAPVLPDKEIPAEAQQLMAVAAAVAEQRRRAAMHPVRRLE